MPHVDETVTPKDGCQIISESKSASIGAATFRKNDNEPGTERRYPKHTRAATFPKKNAMNRKALPDVTGAATFQNIAKSSGFEHRPRGSPQRVAVARSNFHPGAKLAYIAAYAETVHLGPLPLGLAQLGSACATWVRATWLCATWLCATWLCATCSVQLGSVQLGSVQLGSVQLGSVQFGPRAWCFWTKHVSKRNTIVKVWTP